MNNTKRYGLVNKSNIVPLHGENTRRGNYLVRAVKDDGFTWDPKALPIKRKFSTREAARAYKRWFVRNPQNWAIVNLDAGAVVR